MSSELRTEEVINHEHFHTKTLLTVAAWSGLAAGIVEAIGLLVFQKLGAFGGLDEVDIPILWVSPAVDLLLFTTLGLLLLLVFQLIPQLPRTRIVIFSFALLTFLDWILLGEKVRLIGAFFLSLGMAVAFTRWWAKHELSMLKLMRRTLPIFIAILPLVLGVTFFARRFQEQHALAALPPASPGSPNVLLIIVDTLRSDHLSAYGYVRETTPHLDQLAREGVLFENAFAASSWTLPSHASLLTGRYPFEHGAVIRDYRGPYPTLAEALRNVGYRTAAFSANLFFFTKQRGFGRGFLHFEDSFESLPDMAIRTLYGRKFTKDILPLLGYQDIPARRRAAVINRSALRWIDNTRGHPFFVCLNYLDTHDPYFPVAPYRTRFSKLPKPGGIINDYRGRRESRMSPQELQGEIDAYDGGISYMDDNVGQLVDELTKRGLDRNTLVVITSDHGEGFMEHGLVQHKNALYREMIQVPLILWWPGHLPAGLRISRPVSNVAVPLTVTDLIGADSSSVFPGASLAQLWHNPDSASTWANPLVELAYMPFPGLENNPNYHGWMESLITPEWHYILHEKYGPSLYRWSQDPKESQNLASTSEGSVLSTGFASELQSRLPKAEADQINAASANRAPSSAPDQHKDP